MKVYEQCLNYITMCKICWDKIKSLPIFIKIGETYSTIIDIWFRPKTRDVEPVEILKLLSLSPTSDCGEGEELNAQAYFEAIDNALKDKSVYNIGIVGSYGSGKSSIIKSFCQKYSNYKIQNISLASFIDSKPIRPKAKDNQNADKQLEYSIIQQILYSVTADRLPKSRFKRIHSNICYWKPVCLIILFLLSLIIVVEPNWLISSSLWTLVTWDKHWMALSALVVLIITLGIIVAYGVFVIKMYKLSKISLKSGEIELDTPDERSILNRYLDELLYYFEKGDNNIIVIEDLDRFERPNIFSKLRELNLLINNYAPIKKKHKKVVFIYAVKDDIFTSPHKRVKFFDLLIPIIPYVDAFNSADAFAKLISGRAINIDTDIIYNTLAFVDDMRLLKNIYNELIVIEKIVQSKGKLWNQIFPISVYKNLYPDDFALTNKKKGLINQIFSSESKKMLVEKSAVVLNGRISKIEVEIRDVNNNKTNDIKSLRNEYIEALINLLIVKFTKYTNRKDEQVNIAGELVSIDELTMELHFDALRESGVSEFKFNSDSYDCEITFDEIEVELGADQDYQTRLNQIAEQAKDYSELAKCEISAIQREIEVLHKKSVAELANIVELGEVFEQLKQDDKKLAIALFRNGYIKEDFSIYISIFIQGKFTPADNEFIINKASGTPVGYDFHVDNPKTIRIENMKNETDYQNPSTLNYDLLKSFIDEDIDTDSKCMRVKSESMHYKYVSTILKLPYLDKYRFIDGFCKGYQKDVVSFFINYLIERETDIWSKTTSVSDITIEQKWNFLSHLLVYALPDNIPKIAKDEKLCTFIKDSKNILYRIRAEATENTKVLLGYVNPKLDLGDFIVNTQDIRNDDLLNYIYANNMYTISEKMIEYMLQNNMPNYDADRFKNACYTYIKESQCDTLISYIDNDIEKFVKSVFLKMQTLQTESCNSLAMLCNHSDDDIAMAVIDKTTTIILDINIIGKRLWNKLILTRRIECSWSNIVSYFEFIDETLNDNLISYLDESYNNLIDSGQFEYIQKSYKSFAIEILTSDKLQSEAHVALSNMVHNISIGRNEIRTTSIKEDGEDKLRRLMNLGLVNINESIIKALREYAEPLQIELLEMYPDKCEELTIKHKYIVNASERLRLLKSNKLSEQLKIAIAYSMTPNNINADGISHFLLFTGVEKFTKQYIELILFNTTDAIQTRRLLIDYIKLWNIQSNQEIDNLLSQLDCELQKIANSNKRFSISNTGINLKLMQLLNERGYIKEYTENSHKINIVKE